MPRTKKVEETKPVAKKPVTKKKIATKPKTKKVENTQVIKPSDDLSKFPYDTFPYRIQHDEGKNKKTCWFTHESHVHKYIERHNLSKRDYVAECYNSLN